MSIARFAPLLALAPSLVSAAPPDGGGFHLEPKATIDDVFGDAADYRRVIDKFLSISDGMQGTRDEFARAVQSVLAELRPGPDGKARPRKCPDQAVASSYARALGLGQEYLRAGRELSRYYDQVREYDRLGETVGLTPDYRWKVKRVAQQYGALLTDYREMKVAFHDQLADELRFVGCDLDKLAARGGATRDEAWPQAEQLAPGAPTEKVALPTPPPSQPKPVRAEPIDILPPRAGILFYVDNTRCQVATKVALDGRPLGDVPAATRAAFPTRPGPHDLCLIPDGATKKCGDPGTLRKSYFTEGWTIALRCD